MHASSDYASFRISRGLIFCPEMLDGHVKIGSALWSLAQYFLSVLAP